MTSSQLTTGVLILAAAVIARFLCDRLSRRAIVPSVVVELLLGVLLGPVVLADCEAVGAGVTDAVPE